MDSFILNLPDPAFIANPFPYYKALREATSIVYSPTGQRCYISVYEDVDALLRDRRLGRFRTVIQAGVRDPSPESPLCRVLD